MDVRAFFHVPLLTSFVLLKILSTATFVFLLFYFFFGFDDELSICLDRGTVRFYVLKTFDGSVVPVFIIGLAPFHSTKIDL